MIVGAACISHTPLLDKARTDPAVEAEFGAAVTRASEQIAEWRPDLTVVFFPDHFNGFFYDLMPSFCIGVRATSIGDFGTVPGPLNVPEDLAIACARSCLEQGVDVATSYRMSVDHGASQPIELLSEALPLSTILPIFINCAAPPVPRFARVRALGEAVGHWAAGINRRVLFVASGGLSHDPPLPSIATASPEAEAALIDNRNMHHAGRLARQGRTYNARFGYAAGTSSLRSLNPDWDNAFLRSLVEGDLAVADAWSDDAITQAGGRGAHEVRTWIAALAALNATGGYRAEVEFYRPITEWLTGTALLSAQP